MNEINIKSWSHPPLVLLLFTLSTIFTYISVSLGQDNPSTDIVSKILSAQRDLKNYRCSVEYIDTISYESRKRGLETARKSGELPQEIIKNMEDDLQGSGKKYELQDVVADAAGRIKVSSIVGNYDDAGNRHDVRKVVHAWDGEMGILYSDYLKDDYPGGAIINAKKQKDFILMRRPLWSFAGRFVEALERTSNEGKSIELKHNQTNKTWQISFEATDFDFSTKKHVWKGTVDPARNFSVTSGEKSQVWHGGIMRYSTDYKQFNDGLWFPIEEKSEGFYADGVNEYVTNAKITNIVVNDPNLGKSTFHIDLPKGTRVQDNIRGIVYIVGDPLSVRKQGEFLRRDSQQWSVMAREGTDLPEFDGIKIDLPEDRIKGKTVLICFFDMNQRPSRNCLMQLSKKAKELTAKDIAVVAIQTSKLDQDKLNDWVKENGIVFTVGMIQDDEEKTRFTWGVRSLPWLILTDKIHIVTAEGFGVSELDDKLNDNSH